MRTRMPEVPLNASRERRSAARDILTGALDFSRKGGSVGAMPAWLMKSEPEVFSFEDLKKRHPHAEPWNGVRNYQARNFMRDAMTPGDAVLFYHSNCPEPGVVGLARVATTAMPDPTQFDPQSEYFDPKATPDKPRWVLVDVAWARDFRQPVPLAVLKNDPALAGLLATRPGNRLSITPVSPEHFRHICQLGGMR